tara:strand:- start:1040 stop:1948 length:909 start_codon:yes stop_codon:yes gene_type:complete
VLDIRKLTYFLTIARAGSLSRAAQELRIAQPALSHHISQIEAHFGVKLLDRHSRGVTPTQVGRLLQSQAEKIVRDIRNTEEALREHSDVLTGEVSVGVISSLSAPITGQLLEKAARDFPRVRVYIREGDSPTLARGLAENRIDLAISLLGASSETTEALADEPLYLVSNKKMALDCEEIALRDALSLPLVLPSREHVLRSIVEGFASQIASVPNLAVEIDGYATVRSAVLNGYGYAIIGRASFESDFAHDFLTYRIIEPQINRRIVLQRSEAALNQSVASQIADVIHMIAADLIEKGIWGPV